jgi:hypothetical protein
LQYIPIAIAFLGALVAIRGTTWDQTKTSWRALTTTGWVVGILAVAACITQIIFTFEKVESAENRERIAWQYLETTLESVFYEAADATNYFVRGESFAERDAKYLRALLREFHRAMASDIANHRSWIAVDDLRKLENALLSSRHDHREKQRDSHRERWAAKITENCRELRDPLDITLEDIEPTTAQAVTALDEMIFLSSSILSTLCPDSEGRTEISCGIADDNEGLENALYNERRRRVALWRIDQLRSDPERWASFERQFESRDPRDEGVQDYLEIESSSLVETVCDDPEGV